MNYRFLSNVKLIHSEKGREVLSWEGWEACSTGKENSSELRDSVSPCVSSHMSLLPISRSYSFPINVLTLIVDILQIWDSTCFAIQSVQNEIGFSAISDLWLQETRVSLRSHIDYSSLM